VRSLRRFLALPPADRRLLAAAGLFLAFAGVALKVLPFRTVCRLLPSRRPAAGGRQEGDDRLAQRVAWAVNAASRRLPGCRGCLPRALAARALLECRGAPARLRLGVARDAGGDAGGLRAHAWVECRQQVVTGGGGDLSLYVPLGNPSRQGPGGSEPLS
jgi:hypothetical protein